MMAHIIPKLEDRAVPDFQARNDIALIARDAANHEKVCADRMNEIRDKFEDVFRRLWWFVAIIIGGQGMVIVILARTMIEKGH